MKVKSNPVNARVAYFPPESEAMMLLTEQSLLGASRETIVLATDDPEWDPED